MKNLRYIILSGVAVTMMIIFQSCPSNLPVIETKSVVEADVTSTTAIVRGTVVDNGGDFVSERGICFGTAIDPTEKKSATEGGNGDFEVTLTDLIPDKEYYVRAYGINKAGINYGQNLSFKTKRVLTAPEVSTVSVEEVTSTSAVIQGNVISDGGTEITERGICYGTSPDPTEKVIAGQAGTGIFEVTVTDLDINEEYYVRAYAMNSIGTSYGVNKSFTTEGEKPEADFEISETSPKIGESVQFTDRSTNNPTSWTWEFGDGQSSTNQNPSHAYNTPGIYDVKLTVSNQYGSDTESKGNVITAGSPPEAEFSASSTTVLVGESIQFTDLSLYTPTSWNWNFGDNNTSSSKNPSHAYSSAGTYTVILTATNGVGSDIETKVDYITVLAVPEFVSATVENATPKRLDLTFDQTLASSAPNSSAFAVTVNSKVRAVNSVSISGNIVMITLVSPVSVGNSVSVSYTKPSVLPIQTVAGGQAVSFTGNVNNKVATILDGDGNNYTSVTIGSQEWLRENLKTTKYNDGTSITLMTGDLYTWTTPGYCWYENNPNYKNTYGALYNWYTVNENTLCPAGWHVPTDAEWKTLINNTGGESAAFNLKEKGTVHWKTGNSASNKYDFTALPGGKREMYYFMDITGYGWWWTSSQSSNSQGICHWMGYSLDHVNSWNVEKQKGMSCRCVKDK